MYRMAAKIFAKKYMPKWFKISIQILFKMFCHLNISYETVTFYPSLASNVFKQLCVSFIAPSKISSGQSGGHKTLAPRYILYYAVA